MFQKPGLTPSDLRVDPPTRLKVRRETLGSLLGRNTVEHPAILELGPDHRKSCIDSADISCVSVVLDRPAPY